MTSNLAAIRYLIIVILLLTTACSSVPVGTLLKLSSFDEQYVSTLDPHEIRAKITVNAFLDVNLDDTKLGITIDNDKGEMALNFPLEIITLTQNKAIPGFFSQQPASQTYLLKLSPQAIADFKTLQSELTPPKESKFGFSVDAKLKKHKNLTTAQSEQQLFMSIDLKLNHNDGFFTLFDKLELQEGKTDL